MHPPQNPATALPPTAPPPEPLAALLDPDAAHLLSDDRVRAVLLQLAELLRTPPAPADSEAEPVPDPRVISCLTAAADELLDPLRPPTVPTLHPPAALGLADAQNSVYRIRALLLDRERAGDVRQVLARGRAARELAQALHMLDQQVSTRSAGSSDALTANKAAQVSAVAPGACTCGAGR